MVVVVVACEVVGWAWLYGYSCRRGGRVGVVIMVVVAVEVVE